MKKRLAIQMGMINILCLFLSQNTTALFEEYGTYETIDGNALQSVLEEWDEIFAR